MNKRFARHVFTGVLAMTAVMAPATLTPAAYADGGLHVGRNFTVTSCTSSPSSVLVLRLDGGKWFGLDVDKARKSKKCPSAAPYLASYHGALSKSGVYSYKVVSNYTGYNIVDERGAFMVAPAH